MITIAMQQLCACAARKTRNNCINPNAPPDNDIQQQISMQNSQRPRQSPFQRASANSITQHTLDGKIKKMNTRKHFSRIWQTFVLHNFGMPIPIFCLQAVILRFPREKMKNKM